ncbi:hypothetical protein [Nocardioides sp.]|uniref:hypothetical protein n=1 Tax=Nocardioides sp. TaxID=35761 RepID=UPI00351411C3
MRRLPLLLAVPTVGVALLLSGCSGEESPSPGATPAEATTTETTTTATDAPADAALSVVSSTLRSTGCLRSVTASGDPVSGRYLDFDTSWRTTAPVVVNEIELIDPVGVELGEGPQIVPSRTPDAPVIDSGQLPAEGADLGALAAARRLDFAAAVPAQGAELAADRSGVFLLRLDYAVRRPFSYGGVRVTYTPTDSATPVTVEAPAEITGRFTRGCAR